MVGLMSMSEVFDTAEVDQHLTALISNAGAVKAIGEVIERTLGPKGLDCMLIDQIGNVIVTNDGVTILKAMDVNHPAAKILISAAMQQEELVGDGTTTATVIAGAMIAAGVEQIIKGVPATKIIEGIRTGIQQTLKLLATLPITVEDIDSPILERIAFIAGREHQEIAELIIRSVHILGGDKLKEPGFQLAAQILALDGAESNIIQGTVIHREPLNMMMPRRLERAGILILDDSLEPVQIDSESLGTEIGFNQKLHNEQILKDNISKLSELGVKAIFTDRTISDSAEDQLTDLGILGIQRVARQEWIRLAEMTGARPIKKGSLVKPLQELQQVIGGVDRIEADEKFKHIKIFGNPNQKYVTILIGAQTKEVVCERERIAKDAASAVQAAWQGGVVPGGGSVELGIAHHLSKFILKGMTNYGYECVIKALRSPMALICANAGYNPLEKIEEAMIALTERGSYSIGVNCDTGLIEDLTKTGIWDPYYVKYHAIKSAGEVAEAILRINTIIKMKETDKQ
jgi:chaperonin GroEL (HSP60 family)